VRLTLCGFLVLRLDGCLESFEFTAGSAHNGVKFVVVDELVDRVG
jgi:hypothetical protein